METTTQKVKLNPLVGIICWLLGGTLLLCMKLVCLIRDFVSAFFRSGKGPKVVKLEVGDKFPSDFTGCVETVDGIKMWLIKGTVHRDNGPAMEFPDGTKKYYQDGYVHRIDGPAIVLPDGTNLYRIHNTPLTSSQFEAFQVLWENTKQKKTRRLAEDFLSIVISRT